MPTPSGGPEAPPQFHPEFGYFWPAPQVLRMLRVGLICMACGVLVGAIAVLAGMSPDRSDSAAGVIAQSPVADTGTATVGRAYTEPVSATVPDGVTANTCSEQTWPYLADNCMSDPEGTGKKDVRVLRPDQPAESAPAMVIAAPSGKEVSKAAVKAATAKAEANTAKAEAKEAADVKETAKKEKKRSRHVKRARQQRDRDVDQAYAEPDRDRYEMRRSDWGWGGW